VAVELAWLRAVDAARGGYGSDVRCSSDRENVFSPRMKDDAIGDRGVAMITGSWSWSPAARTSNLP
jgi:hypothetical protein